MSVVGLGWVLGARPMGPPLQGPGHPEVFDPCASTCMFWAWLGVGQGVGEGKAKGPRGPRGAIGALGMLSPWWARLGRGGVGCFCQQALSSALGYQGNPCSGQGDGGRGAWGEATPAP